MLSYSGDALYQSVMHVLVSSKTINKNFGQKKVLHHAGRQHIAKYLIA